MTFPKKTKTFFMTLSLVFVLGLASCDGDPIITDTTTDPTTTDPTTGSSTDTTIPDDGKYRVTGPYMKGKEAKEVYNAYLGQSIGTLNSSASQSATDVRHLANLIDGLVMNDEYGVLQRQLASSGWVNDDKDEFRFTIKDDVAWYKHDGEQYVNVDKQGNRAPQFVTADDFLHSAEIILNYANDSEVAYMVTLFVDGAWEYYCYTQMLSLIKDQNMNYAGINWRLLKSASNDAKAEALMILIEFESGSSDIAYIDGDDLANIANFSRVGIIADGQEITYRLNQPAHFFPTILTYAPFYPINRAFYKDIGKAKFGTSKENTIYNGPFLCTEWSDNKVQYTRNENYYDIGKVHVKTVNYTIAPDTITYADMREAFEAGTVDGFTVAREDAVGWEQYITGPNNTGTIQDPYSTLVNSRELDTIDYTWHFTLNVERDEDLSVQPNTIMAADADKFPNAIRNTNKALKLKEVRRLVLDAINFEVYNESNEATAEDIHQYQLNTFVPKGYVVDENGKDYNDYYYEEYAAQKGYDTVEEVKDLIGPQTITGVNYTQTQVTQMYNDAQSAVAKYNAANSGDPITLPIIIEHAGLAGYASEQYKYENAWIEDFNIRANGRALEEDDWTFIRMYNNLEANSSDKSSKNAYGAYYTLITWGWIGDYADPLTYMNCYKTNGDMSLFSGTREARDNYYLDGDNLVKDADGLLGRYDALVNSAKEIYNSDALRYEEFAKAEYELINNAYIVKPHSMYSQGWAVSVSRAIGYQSPTAPYGLAGYRLTGLWVLVDPPTGEERVAARDLHDANKAAALAETGSYNFIGSDDEE
ncbi:MAG: ABC transporter substrate-binding protein [Bacilli bacterium]|jgi:ABC-type oligopeptide transport system substrate-binding subunit